MATKNFCDVCDVELGDHFLNDGERKNMVNVDKILNRNAGQNGHLPCSFIFTLGHGTCDHVCYLCARELLEVQIKDYLHGIKRKAGDAPRWDKKWPVKQIEGDV